MIELKSEKIQGRDCNAQFFNNKKLNKMKPIITYDYLETKNGITYYSVKSDGREIQVITGSNAGWSSSAQELTLSKVKNIADYEYGDGNYILPYYVDGGGYVFQDNKQMISA